MIMLKPFDIVFDNAITVYCFKRHLFNLINHKYLLILRKRTFAELFLSKMITRNYTVSHTMRIDI